ERYLSEIRTSFTPRKRAYARARAVLGFLAPLWSVAAALLLLLTRASVWMRDLARRMTRHRYVQVLAYFVLFSAATYALQFPLTWYGEFALEHQYGLSRRALAPWLTEQ